uniref:Secreted protein n=1 Tax=Ixodes ricinus TaxID=34613 RepID=A0A6B0U0Y3_IXORI
MVIKLCILATVKVLVCPASTTNCQEAKENFRTSVSMKGALQMSQMSLITLSLTLSLFVLFDFPFQLPRVKN